MLASYEVSLFSGAKLFRSGSGHVGVIRGVLVANVALAHLWHIFGSSRGPSFNLLSLEHSLHYFGLVQMFLQFVKRVRIAITQSLLVARSIYVQLKNGLFVLFI